MDGLGDPLDIEVGPPRLSYRDAARMCRAAQTVPSLRCWRLMAFLWALAVVVSYAYVTDGMWAFTDGMGAFTWDVCTPKDLCCVFDHCRACPCPLGLLLDVVEDASQCCLLALAVFELCATVLPCFFPSVYWLYRSRRAKAFTWPTAEEVHRKLSARGYQEQDRLSLGMSRFAMRDALLMLLPGYARSQDAWFSRTYESESGGIILGYDLIEAIKCRWEETGLQAFSVAEVLYAMGHPGVSKATVFISHVQVESLLSTLIGVKRIAESSWKEPSFWLDYFCLGQCVSDFKLERVKTIIRKIGSTALLTERVGLPPRAINRSYCLFEWYATLLSPARKFWIQPIEPSCSDFLRLLRVWHRYDIDIRVAQCRSTNTKREIDEMIEQEIGTAELQELLEAELVKADRRAALKPIEQFAWKLLRTCVIIVLFFVLLNF